MASETGYFVGDPRRGFRLVTAEEAILALIAERDEALRRAVRAEKRLAAVQVALL